MEGVYKQYTMHHAELKDLLARINGCRIGIVGDFCLDVYLLLEPAESESSLETGLSTRPVRTQRYSLGAAGNVVSNLQAMGVGTLRAFGVIGEDPFGREMTELLSAKGVDTTGLLVQREQWDTHVYMKPYEREQEQHRLDFGNFNDLHAFTAESLLKAINSALPNLDLVIINQQVHHGIHTANFREALRALVLSHPEKQFIADTRHFADEYTGCMMKINSLEAARLVGRDSAGMDAAELEELATSLYQRRGKPVFLTRGENGCIVCDKTGCNEIPGLLILSPVDPVGAGDSMLAGIAAALASDAEPLQAAELGSLVAGVTVQKLMQTGTATAEEILRIGTDPDRRYKPDLAHQARKAVYHPDTEIEIVSALPQRQTFTHVIFDHDGTLSTLRQGWESIMKPMMVRAILGGGEREADEALHAHVIASVHDYIDKTTGMQTLAQMKGLVNLVRRFRCVPEAEILDESGYKKMYNEELTALVSRRIQKLERGELSANDCVIKNASEFLNRLHHRRVVLYLASGTDREDLEREAEILGYRQLFGERIYGAVGDVSFEAKRMVLEKILADIGDTSRANILTFGDGPVEIRETHKKGGYAVGVASDEIRRYGLNTAKRTRLIEAGADLVVPDYSQIDQLLELLFGR
jgi:bifunctional ADP-heptose synthase (sugar kinase/adenylyltransferase)/phosphoglycolate phosphatase-like HAD superfamily hydrolase